MRGLGLELGGGMVFYVMKIKLFGISYRIQCMVYLSTYIYHKKNQPKPIGINIPYMDCIRDMDMRLMFVFFYVMFESLFQSKPTHKMHHLRRPEVLEPCSYLVAFSGASW